MGEEDRGLRGSHDAEDWWEWSDGSDGMPALCRRPFCGAVPQRRDRSALRFQRKDAKGAETQEEELSDGAGER